MSWWVGGVRRGRGGTEPSNPQANYRNVQSTKQESIHSHATFSIYNETSVSWETARSVLKERKERKEEKKNAEKKG